MTDPTNCGTPGNPCGSGTNTCVSGTCQAPSACVAPLTRCVYLSPNLAECVDTQTDPLNCGGCDSPCASDQVCIAGFCENYDPAVPCTACPCTGVCATYLACCPSYTGSTVSPEMCVAGGVCP
jgi:hypothetical protein